MSAFKSNFSVAGPQPLPPMAAFPSAPDETKDLLLNDFTEEQKKYIVSELYPLLKQSLLHFMNESIETENYKIRLVTQELSKQEVTSKKEEQLPKTASAFGGFSMGGPKKPEPTAETLTPFKGFSMGSAPKAQDDAVPGKLMSPNPGSSFAAFSMGGIQPEANQSAFSNFSISMAKEPKNDFPTGFQIPAKDQQQKMPLQIQNIPLSEIKSSESPAIVKSKELQIEVDDYTSKVVPFQTARPTVDPRSKRGKLLTPVRHVAKKPSNVLKDVQAHGKVPQSAKAGHAPAANEYFSSLKSPMTQRRHKPSALANKLQLPSNREIQSMASMFASKNMKNPYVYFKTPTGKTRPVTPRTFESKPWAADGNVYPKFIQANTSASFGQFKLGGAQNPGKAPLFSQLVFPIENNALAPECVQTADGTTGLRNSKLPTLEPLAQTMPSQPSLTPIPEPVAVAPLSPPVVEKQQSEAATLFMKCFDKVFNKKVPNLNPTIFRTQGGPSAPANFKQVVPSQAYRQQKRGSVFQKVDLSKMDFDKIPNYPKPQDQTLEVIKLLKQSFLTKNLSDTEVEKLAGAMVPKEYKPEDLIIKYGDVGSEYFILSKGEVQVLVYKKDTDPKEPEIEKHIQFTKVMQKGAGFGELSLLYNDKRSASIKAIGECTAYVLDGNVFKTVIIKSSLDKRSLQTGFLDKIKLFDQLEKSQKMKLSEGLKTVYMKKDDFIIREGDHGENFYIIEAGQVDCLKLQTIEGKMNFINVRTLHPGDHFGELALINNQKRSLSIKVKSDSGCKLLTLDRDCFERILGSIEMHLKKDYDKKF